MQKVLTHIRKYLFIYVIVGFVLLLVITVLFERNISRTKTSAPFTVKEPKQIKIQHTASVLNVYPSDGIGREDTPFMTINVSFSQPVTAEDLVVNVTPENALEITNFNETSLAIKLEDAAWQAGTEYTFDINGYKYLFIYRPDENLFMGY